MEEIIKKAQKLLQENKPLLANREINGHRLIDLVEIQEAVPKDGYIAFKTKLIIPDDVKDTLKGLLHK